MQDSHMRSVFKGITWRVIASLITMTLVYVFTGSLTISLSLGVVEVLSKVTAYYLHERIWGVISWGRVSPKELKAEN